MVHHAAINAYIQFLDMTYNEANYRIINLYALTAVDRRRQCYAELQHLVINDNTLILGDFNSVQAPSDRISSRLDGTSKYLSSLIADTNLAECDHNRMFTFQNPGDVSKQSCLDLILGPK